MSHRPRWLSHLAVVVVASVMVLGCTQGGATTAPGTPAATPTQAPATSAPATPAPATSAPASSAPASSAPASSAPASSAPASSAPASSAPASEQPSAGPTGTPYPTSGEQPPAPAADLTSYPNYGGDVDCAAGTFNNLPYSGNLKKISAPDAKTVVFEFCNPDVAFLSQVAFTALGIDDADYLIAHAADGSYLNASNGTGPYKFATWDKGNRMTFVANNDYWSTKPLTPNLEFRWSDQSAQRLVELNSGSVDGIDNPGKDDLPAIESNTALKFFPRTGLNTFYLGFNNKIKPFDDLKVRQAIAMGIDRQRIVDNFYPPGSSVATHFTPCEIPFGCDGKEEWYKFDAVAAKQLLADAGFPDGFTTKLQFRAAVRGYLPDPPTIAQEIQSQLKTNLGIDATLDLQESGTFLDNNAAGTLDGIFMLGWGADYPDTSNFLDYHFGPATGKKFGDPIPDLVTAVKKAGESSVETDRSKFYGEANDLIKANVPAVIIAHGGSGTAFKADVEGAYAAPLLEEFSVMKAADRDTLVFMQNAEPLSLYCGDESDGETLRACDQIKESLYGYKIGGTDTEPRLAKECKANETLTTWTCTLQEGVKFHDGADFDASDVILTYAAQWDALSPLHKGRTGAFEYWPALVGGGYLNPPAPCGLPNSAPCEQ